MCAGSVYHDEETSEGYEMEHDKGLGPGHEYTLISGINLLING